MRKQKHKYPISEVLDAGFDDLPLAAMDTFKRKANGIPHCDCRPANELFFKTKLSMKMRPHITDAFTMVPVAVKKDRSCVHCGYMTMLQPPQDYTHAYANRINSQKALEKRNAKRSNPSA